MSTTNITWTGSGLTVAAVTIGVTRIDTGAVVVAPGTAMTAQGGGVFALVPPITDPAGGLIYSVTLNWTYANGTTGNITYTTPGGPGPNAAPQYLLAPEALVIGASMLNVAAFVAATTANQNAALTAATADLDTAMRYQGRRVDLVNQLTEFPRVAYESNTSSASYNYVGPLATNMLPGGNTVWDWDSVNQVAIVPDRVKRACVLQANSLLNPTRLANLDRAAAGLTSQKIGSAAETYDIAQMIAASGGSLALCREAAALMGFYRIRQGRML